jgi:hypothetical protein
MDAAERVKRDFNLPETWINVGPTAIVRLGLPFNLEQRLTKKRYSSALYVYFISRLDQIHFKLYASADRGGHHIDDLMALNPKTEELERAARWSMTPDVSIGFRLILKDLLKKLGYPNVSERI